MQRLLPRIVALALSGCMALSLTGVGPATAREVPLLSVIVRSPGGAEAAGDALRAAGGTVTLELPIVSGVAGTVPADHLDELQALGVDVSPNEKVTLQHRGHKKKCRGVKPRRRYRRCKRAVHNGKPWPPTSTQPGTGGGDGGSTDPGDGGGTTDPDGGGDGGTGGTDTPPAANDPIRIQKVIRADDLWAEGITGKGVTIAVLDTGVYAEHPDLAGRVLHCVDLSGEFGSAPAPEGPAPLPVPTVSLPGLPSPGLSVSPLPTALPSVLPTVDITPLPSLSTSPVPLPSTSLTESPVPLPTLSATSTPTSLPSTSLTSSPASSPSSVIPISTPSVVASTPVSVPSTSLPSSPVPALTPLPGLPRTAGRVSAAGDTSECNDPFGHGTFMAGLALGDGTVSGGLYSGAAPDANLVAIKASGFDGSTDVSKILAGIQWTVAHKDLYGIRVLNLSLGSDSTQDYRLSPLNFAVERAWQAGIVVVVSSGNSGPDAKTVMKPGDDPYVITVGSSNDEGTLKVSDDQVPVFSSRGVTRSNGLMKPDVVSPGVHTVGLRSPGSAIDQKFASARVGTGYFRGSGTSMSTASVSGIVALILQKNPNLTPDQLKYRLLNTTRAIAETDPTAAGRGLVDAYAATHSTSTAKANQGLTPSSGLGSLELDRGTVKVDVVTPLGQVDLSGDLVAMLDPDGVSASSPTGLLPWVGATYTESGWDAASWKAASWKGDDWAAASWKAASWKATEWEAASWKGTDWENPDWDAASWKGVDWDAASWKAASWKSAWYGVAWD